MGSLRSGLRQSEWQPPRRVSSQSQFNVEPVPRPGERQQPYQGTAISTITTETTLSKWRIHSSDNDQCIARVSLWDTTTREQIGSVIEYTHRILSMTMSSNYDLVTSGDKKITLTTLWQPFLSLFGQCKRTRLLKKTSNRKPPYLLLQTPERRKSSTQRPKKLTTVQVRSFAP